MRYLTTLIAWLAVIVVYAQSIPFDPPPLPPM